MADGRLGLATLRAAWWARWSLRSARRQLGGRALHAVRLADPPPLPASAGRGVLAVLRRADPSCLERSLVLQRWLAAHGDRRTVVVGVSAPRGFRAHAWLDGEPMPDPGFSEILRLAP